MDELCLLARIHYYLACGLLTQDEVDTLDPYLSSQKLVYKSA